jgi:hypothetical protein
MMCTLGTSWVSTSLSLIAPCVSILFTSHTVFPLGRHSYTNSLRGSFALALSLNAPLPLLPPPLTLGAYTELWVAPLLTAQR